MVGHRLLAFTLSFLITETSLSFGQTNIFCPPTNSLENASLLIKKVSAESIETLASATPKEVQDLNTFFKKNGVNLEGTFNEKDVEGLKYLKDLLEFLGPPSIFKKDGTTTTFKRITSPQNKAFKKSEAVPNTYLLSSNAFDGRPLTTEENAGLRFQGNGSPLSKTIDVLFTQRLAKEMILNLYSKDDLEKLLDKMFGLKIAKPSDLIDKSTLHYNETNFKDGSMGEFSESELAKIIVAYMDLPPELFPIKTVKFIARGPTNATVTEKYIDSKGKKGEEELEAFYSNENLIMVFLDSAFKSGASTFRHEFGHAVDANLPKELQKKYFDLSWIATPKGFIPFDTKEDGIFLTEYSHTNPREDLAEHFRLYLGDPERFREKAPEKYKFFADYVFKDTEYFMWALPQHRKDVTQTWVDKNPPKFTESLDSLKLISGPTLIADSVSNRQKQRVILQLKGLTEETEVKYMSLFFKKTTVSDTTVSGDFNIHNFKLIDKNLGIYEVTLDFDLRDFETGIYEPNFLTAEDIGGNSGYGTFKNKYFQLDLKAVNKELPTSSILKEGLKIEVEEPKETGTTIHFTVPVSRKNESSFTSLEVTFGGTQTSLSHLTYDEKLKVYQGDVTLSSYGGNRKWKLKDFKFFEEPELDYSTEIDVKTFHPADVRPPILLEDQVELKEAEFDPKTYITNIKIEIPYSQVSPGDDMGVHVTLRSPSGREITHGTSFLSAGTNGVYKYNFDLPPHHESGTWLLKEVRLEKGGIDFRGLAESDFSFRSIKKTITLKPLEARHE
ncbi:MAG: putative exported protein [Bacteriovoracaceae bacterium]|nr:putative exported protein [Bacteriovoracaceae bacterium]